LDIMYISSQQKGFTLVELLVTLVIVGAVTTISYNVYNRISNAWTCRNLLSDVQQSARVAMDSIIRDLQMAGFDAKKSSEYPTEPTLQDLKDIETAQSDEISFQYRNDSVTDSNKHRKYIYRLDGTELKKKTIKWVDPIIGGGIGKPSQTGYYGAGSTRIIAKNVTDFKLAYYDGNTGGMDVPVNDTDSIRLIKVSITLEGEKGCPQNKFIRLITSVAPRNIGMETAIH